jgi:hypothetical protein
VKPGGNGGCRLPLPVRIWRNRLFHAVRRRLRRDGGGKDVRTVCERGGTSILRLCPGHCNL